MLEKNIVVARDNCRKEGKFVRSCSGKIWRPETARKKTCGCEDIIKIAHKQNETVEWIHLAEDGNW